MLEDISVVAEGGMDSFATGNPLPILHELRHALRRLADTGQDTVIDLDALPLAPGEREQLLDRLGAGEVVATVHALGVTEIQETAFAGVWLIAYKDQQGHAMTTQLEVCRMPRILYAQDESVREAIDRLDRELTD